MSTPLHGLVVETPPTGHHLDLDHSIGFVDGCFQVLLSHAAVEHVYRLVLEGQLSSTGDFILPQKYIMRRNSFSASLHEPLSDACVSRVCILKTDDTGIYVQVVVQRDCLHSLSIAHSIQFGLSKSGIALVPYALK